MNLNPKAFGAPQPKKRGRPRQIGLNLRAQHLFGQKCKHLYTLLLLFCEAQSAEVEVVSQRPTFITRIYSLFLA